MTIRELISKTGKWFSAKKESLYEPLRKTPAPDRMDNPFGVITRKNEQITDRTEALQMIGRSFEQLVEKLGGINEHLDQQVKQNEELIQRITEFPQLLQNFPESLKNQRAVIDSLLEQLKTQALKNQQFTEAVDKIPAAADKQTDAISNMAVQLAASADVDAQLAAGFAKFNSITDRLKDNVENQTDSIIQLSKTFSASDRYLKYILNTQHKRFVWVFIGAMAVCTFAIAVLLVIILLLK